MKVKVQQPCIKKPIGLDIFQKFPIVPLSFRSYLNPALISDKHIYNYLYVVFFNIFKCVSHILCWMPLKKREQSLKNLIVSDTCSIENLEKYKKDLIRLSEETADPIESRKQSKFFKSLADEKRIRILKLLTVQEMCVCELMIALDTTQPNLSHHLKILENQGFVNRRKEGKWAYYSLTNLKKIKSLVNTDLS